MQEQAEGHQTQTLQEKYLNAIINRRWITDCPCRIALAEPELLAALLLNWTEFTCRAAPAMAGRTFMVKTAMSLTPIPA
ncbi:gamma-glutamyl-gamma-aminobutyrate hydrolase [Raoultella ornithinolytica]|nr:gamma-glutamyl-gamma-aminobutyrate hydrolase [Raoultella ornithinolytica]